MDTIDILNHLRAQDAALFALMRTLGNYGISHEVREALDEEIRACDSRIAINALRLYKVALTTV